MENIGFFLDACVNFGVPKADLFQTVDLYEGENIPQVRYTDTHSIIIVLFVIYRLLMV